MTFDMDRFCARVSANLGGLGQSFKDDLVSANVDPVNFAIGKTINDNMDYDVTLYAYHAGSLDFSGQLEKFKGLTNIGDILHVLRVLESDVSALAKNALIKAARGKLTENDHAKT